MKLSGNVFLLYRLLMVALISVSINETAAASDFGWAGELNVQARSDLATFKATLETRFRIGDARLKTVFRSVSQPADAYMVLRLGEMSHQPVETVINMYKRYKPKGWGALAQSLGIKPGSKEFHALKAGHDLGGRYAKPKKNQASAGGGASHGKDSTSKGNGKDKDKKHK